MILNELALFAGAGGGILGGKLLGWRTVCAVEINAYCRRVLMQRQDDGCLQPFPIWDDVTTFDGRPWRGIVDVVSGGDPCQANSNAFRHGREAESLGGEFLRIVEEARPQYVVRENPRTVRANAPWPADRFAAGLEAIGYRTVIVEVRACCAGGDHRRARLFVLADLPDANKAGLEGHVGEVVARANNGRHDTNIARPDRWSASPRICGRNHGVANRVDRLEAIGNEEVPRVVALAWRLLSPDR